MLSITAENGVNATGHKNIIEKSFNITLDTIIHPPNDTSTEGTNGTSANVTPDAIPTQNNNAAQPDSPNTPAVGLEPAQAPPKDAESQSSGGSSGAVSPPGNTDNASNAQIPGERPSAPDTIVPVEQLQAQQQLVLDPGAASVLGNAGIQTPQQQQVSEQQPKQQPEQQTEQQTQQQTGQQEAQQVQQTKHQTEQQDQQAKQQTEQLQQAEQTEQNRQPEQSANTEVDKNSISNSELSIQSQPESRQSPAGYDEANQNTNQEQTKQANLEQNKQTSEKESEIKKPEDNPASPKESQPDLHGESAREPINNGT